eukprot:scaffold1130_cov195-Pinguiococcus_pyrenoidosus.AAC.40
MFAFATPFSVSGSTQLSLRSQHSFSVFFSAMAAAKRISFCTSPVKRAKSADMYPGTRRNSLTRCVAAVRNAVSSENECRNTSCRACASMALIAARFKRSKATCCERQPRKARRRFKL